MRPNGLTCALNASFLAPNTWEALLEDRADLIAFRRDLHRRPEVSGGESETAATIARALRGLGADQVITGLGGHGVLAEFRGAADGPSVMLRSELDALPIAEETGLDYASMTPGVAHLCGHDGHSTILMAVAGALAERRPGRGRALLLFQPAEENGSGAAAVLADPVFIQFRPDWAFSLHNMPGLPLGQVGISAGAANCASVGLRLRFFGRTAHASTPETGLSPMPAVLALIPRLQALGPGGILDRSFRLITVTHLNVGAPTFGIAPGEGEVYLTLRTLLDADMAALKSEALALADDVATASGLRWNHDWHDDFAACTNDPQATEVIQTALAATATPLDSAAPMLGSEDFGRFGQGGTKSAMFLLGAGIDHPALHDPRYDFPDGLIPVGERIFLRIIRDLLG